MTPTVTVSIDNTGVNVANITGLVTFTFSEAPVAFSLADTSAVGGTLSYLQQVNATTYTAFFTGAASTDTTNASVSVAAGSWADGNGNAGAAGSPKGTRQRTMRDVGLVPMSDIVVIQSHCRHGRPAVAAVRSKVSLPSSD